MQKDQIKLGGTYLAKVTDKVVSVRIDAANPHGGWDATNLVTNKKVRIKSAQRLRGPVPQRAAQTRPAQPRTRPVAEAQAADAVANADAAPAEITTPSRARRAKKKESQPGEKRLSGLDAAAQILKDSGEAMRCGDMVQKMISSGLWKTGGKTPAATLHAAICREIATKGDTSRFRKTDRGLFTVTM